jgi:signal peptidase I
MQFRGLSLVFASVLGSAMLPGTLALAANETPRTELEALRAEVAALQASVAERDARIHELESRNAALALDLTSVQGAVALASSDLPARRIQGSAPSSNLEWSNALKVATAARFMVQGASMLTVMPTGSMKPVFDERAILLMEPAKFDDLKIGDIVTYKHPRYGMPVVHRIQEKRGDKFWAKGDNNGRMDEVYITRQNYEARVFGIIYAREASAQAQKFGRTLASK